VAVELDAASAAQVPNLLDFALDIVMPNWPWPALWKGTGELASDGTGGLVVDSA